jgi:hypothetical protein
LAAVIEVFRRFAGRSMKKVQLKGADRQGRKGRQGSSNTIIRRGNEALRQQTDAATDSPGLDQNSFSVPAFPWRPLRPWR